MNPDDVRITYHASMRARKRGFRDLDVLATLSNPDVVWQTPKPSWCYERTFEDGRTLKVWTPDLVENQGTDIVVKSAAWKDEPHG